MYYRKIYSPLKLLILTVFALYITTFCSLPALAASPNENCITVNAGASMDVAPDLAYLRCNIVGKGATAAQATARYTKIPRTSYNASAHARNSLFYNFLQDTI